MDHATIRILDPISLHLLASSQHPAPVCFVSIWLLYQCRIIQCFFQFR